MNHRAPVHRYTSSTRASAHVIETTQQTQNPPRACLLEPRLPPIPDDFQPVREYVGHVRRVLLRRRAARHLLAGDPINPTKNMALPSRKSKREGLAPPLVARTNRWDPRRHGCCIRRYTRCGGHFPRSISYVSVVVDWKAHVHPCQEVLQPEPRRGLTFNPIAC